MVSAAAVGVPGGPGGLSREAAALLRRHCDFQRLLAATEGAVTGGVLATASPGERPYQLELNRLLVFLRTLREQLTELQGLVDYASSLSSGNSFGGGSGSGGSIGGGERVTPRTLQGYGFRLDALERTLLARQQEVRRLRAAAAAAAPPPASSSPSSGAVRPRTPVGNRQQQQQQGGAAAGPVSPGGATRKGKRGGGGGGRTGVAIREDEPRMDKESQERVKREQEQQQVLKAQLEELVGALKASSLLVHSSLREQNKVLDKTDDAAQRNLEGLQAELRKTEEQLKRSWSNSLTSCVMIFLMLGIFLATFLFMRVFPKRRLLLW